MRYVTADYIADELVSQFSIEMGVWDIVRLSAKALKRVGAFALKRKVWHTLVSNYQIVLPPDAYMARGALRITPRPQLSNPVLIVDGIEQPSQVFFTEEVDELLSSEPYLLKSNYVPKLIGQFESYEYDHPVMKFNDTDIEVVVEYTGLKVDDEGKPMIPEDATEACLFFCLFTKTQSDYLLKKVDINMMRETERWKDTTIAQARASLTMSTLNTNERDKLMNIMVSMDRKAFNVPS